MIPCKANEPIFIIGMSYSGNTLVSSILRHTREVRCLLEENHFFNTCFLREALPLDEKVDWLVQVLVNADVPPLSDDVAERLRETLLDACRQGAELSLPEMYELAMNKLAKWSGCRRWAQKSTTGIFNVKEILEQFPDAKLIFMMRNPLDIAASVKQRKGHVIYYPIYGWRRMLKLALEYKRIYPDRFLIVRYGKLVTQPREHVETICNFTNVNFSPDLLDTAHVNRAETKMTLDSRERGINQNRLHYYRRVLTPKEERAVRIWIGRKTLKHHFPELDDPSMYTPTTYVKASPVLVRDLSTMGTIYAKRFATSPVNMMRGQKRRFEKWRERRGRLVRGFNCLVA